MKLRNLAFSAILALGAACTAPGEKQSEVLANSGEGCVDIGYITAKAGRLDVESLQRLPSRKQIVKLHRNFDDYDRAGNIARGMRVTLTGYRYNKGPIVWQDESISDGMHRVCVPKEVVREMGVICARVYGHLIANIDHPQIEKEYTSWCEDDISHYVDEPWMQPPDGGYGYPLVVEPYGPNNEEKRRDATS